MDKGHSILRITASVGAVGQAYLLYHELVNSYPYKVMSFPPASFYESIAIWGIFVSPLIAIGSSVVVGSRNRWWAGILPVALCPLIFLAVFVVFTLVRSASGVVETGRNFDGTKATTVAFGFVSYVFWLSIAGSCGGLLINFLDRKFLNKYE